MSNARPKDCMRTERSKFHRRHRNPGYCARSSQGRWRYEPDALVLALYDDRERYIYEVDLERCTTSAEVLDWIMHVAGKHWSTPEVVAGLIHALNQVLRPKANLCAQGIERGPLNVRQHLEQIGQEWSR